MATLVPVSAQAAGKQGSWHVELESRADSTDKGKVTYRLTAAQGLVQPAWKPILTVSEETLTYPPAPGGVSSVLVIKYLSSDVTFQEPDLTCDSVTIRLLSPSDAHGIAAKPAFHFRPDFRGPGFSFQVKIPRGFHYVAGSAHSSRVSGLLPTKTPRTFVKPPEYAPLADEANPHLLSVLLPEPEPRAVGTGLEPPYAIEFSMVPD
jgi:hypothetical protein